MKKVLMMALALIISVAFVDNRVCPGTCGNT